MVKIKKVAGSKQEATLSPFVEKFVREASTVRLFNLPERLESFPQQWPFPRGDLYHWIPLLNRFDHILELFITEYGLKDGPQIKTFGRHLLAIGDGYLEGMASTTENGPVSDLQLVAHGYKAEGDKQLIESILGFSRVLLENCGNRSLYASSSYLDSLLNTTSLSLLLSTLRLAVRLAQRYNASRLRTIGSAQHTNHALLAMHYAIDLEKINKLASPFIKSSQSSEPLNLSTPLSPTAKSSEVLVPGAPTPVHSTDLVAFSDGQAAKKPKMDWQEWGNVYMHYYSEGTVVSKEELKKSQTPSTPSGSSLPNGPSQTPTRRESSRNYSTPTPSRFAPSDDSTGSQLTPDQTQKNGEEQTSKMKHLSVTSSQVSKTPLSEILCQNLPTIPADSRYELLNRLRVAAALSGSEETRRQIVAIRMLALTNLTYVYPEPHLQYKILQQDADEPRRLQLAYQFADLVHPQKNAAKPVPRWLQTIALGGLEALAKQKSRATDVCAALSVNVNHGILLFVLRKAIDDLNKADDPENDIEEDEWREALFSLLMYLPSISRTGEALVSAGLLPILMDGLTHRTAKAERCYPKVLSFLDTFVYNVRDAFQTLANARGLDIIAELTAYEVESAHERAKKGEGMPQEFRNKMIDYQIPYHQQQTLRWLFKFMNHMMSHTGGAFDRLLRNLIDSPPLLKGLRIVLSNAPAFGSNVWSGAVNILSSFIHNEPTSYAVIAEAGLSKAFLEAVTGTKITVPEEKEGSEDSALLSVASSEGTTAQITALFYRGLEAAADDEAYLGVRAQPRKQSTLKARSKATPLARGILPATDAIATVPGAFGAICLNAAGRRLLQASNALESFFEVFESPEHVKCMDTESELPQILGNSFDELVRHHPELKNTVMYSVMLMIARVGQRCRTKARTRGAGAKLWYGDTKDQPVVCGGWPSLIGKQAAAFAQPKQENTKIGKTEAKDSGEDEDIVMADAQMPTANGSIIEGGLSQDPSLDDKAIQTSSIKEEAAGDDLLDTSIPTEKSTEPVRSVDIPSSEDPIVSVYLDVVGKFLSGFFANTTLASVFIDLGGFDYIIDLVTLPSLPYDFNNQSASRSLAGVIHMLVEQKPHLVLPTLVKRTQAAVDDLKPFAEHTKDTAYFRTLTNPQPAGGHTFSTDRLAEYNNLIEKGTDLAKSFVNVHTLSNVLYETFSHSLYNQRSSYTLLNQVNLSDYYAKLVKTIGQLHATCVWEEILLQNSIPESWKEATRFHGFGLGGDEANDILGLLPVGVESEETVDETAAEGSASIPANDSVNGTAVLEARTKPVDDRKSPQFMCVRTLRYLLSQLPATVTPLFQALGRRLIAKRQPDSQQKQNASLVAEAMAEAMLDQLRRGETTEPTPQDKKQDQYSYWILMLTSTSQCLIDGTLESSHSQCLTLVLQAFKNHGGLDAIKEILITFYLEVKDFPFETENGVFPPSNALLTSAFGGIKVILTLFSKLVTAKTIVEATQSASIASRGDRDKDKSDYFSPNQFLVELRYAVVDVIQAIWESNFVERASSSLNKNLIDILKTILEGDQETGAFRKFEKIVPKPKPLPKPWKIPQESLSRLVNEESVDKGLAKEALYRCCSNLNLALEYCHARNTQPRLTSNPIPDQEQFRRPSRPHIASGGSTSRSESNQQRANSADPFTSQTPPAVSSENVTEGTQPGEAQDAGTSGPGDGVYMGHPGANISSNEDLANEELLSMSIDNLIQNLGMPMTPTQNLLQENATNSGSSGENNSLSTVDPSSISASVSQAQIDSGDRKEAVTLDDLNVARESIRESLIERSLNVLNVHGDVTFELSDLIMSAVARVNDSTAMRQDIGETIVQSLLSLQMEDDFRPAGKKIASYAHLLGLVLQDQEFYESTLPELKENFGGLLGFVKKFPGPQEEGSPWIAQILLVTEKLLAEDAQPRQIKWNPPTGDDVVNVEPMAEIADPVVSQSDKQRLFDLVIDILPHLGKDEALALSIARTMVLLTRNRELATQLSERKNLQRLFVMVKQLAGLITEKLQSSLMIILRHIIEDEDTLKQVMRSEIRSFFHMRHDFEMRQGNRPPDTNAYLRAMSSSVLRAPEMFVEVTNEMIKLVRFDPNMRHQAVALKEEDKLTPPIEGEDKSFAQQDNATVQPDSSNINEIKTSTEKETGTHLTTEKQKSTEPKFPVVEKPDGVIHYLLCELLGYKEVTDQAQPVFNPTSRPATPADSTAAETDVAMSNGDDTSSSVAASPPSSIAESKPSEKLVFKADQHPIYIYRCFILQCLTELLSCYNRTKIEFINFSRKNPPNQIITPSKPRSSVLSYLLHDLIPIGSLEHSDDIDYRKRLATSAWAVSTIVSLCAKTGEKGYDKTLLSSDTEEEPDLLFVRKFVLETALKAYKEASLSSEALGIKYSRMLNISDLFDKLLTTKPNNNSSHSTLDMLYSSQKQLAKIMFEKGFIAALTCSVADIDLNFPGAKRAVKYILRPLKSLTDTALEIGSSSSAPVTPGQADTDEISSATSVSDVVDDREETPDLFRNSTLGMFDPNHENPSSSESEDDDDMYDGEEVYGDEMDYDEELSAGEAGDVVSEDEEIEGVGPLEGLSGDVGMDLEVVLDGDEDDDDEDEDDDEDDEDDSDVSDLPEGGPWDNEGDSDWTEEAEDQEAHDDEDDDEDDIEAGDLAIESNSVAAGILDGLRANDPSIIGEELGMEIDPEGYMEEAMDEDDDDDEDDDEDMDDEELIYEPDYDDEDDEGPPWGWDQPEFSPMLGSRHPRAPPHHHHRGLSPWSIFPGGSRDPTMLMPPSFRSRPGGVPAPRPTDEGTNPLLQRNSGTMSGPSRSDRGGEAFSEWVHAIDPSQSQGHRGTFSMDTPVSLISNLIHAVTRGGATGGTMNSVGDNLTLHISGGNGSLPTDFEAMFGPQRPAVDISRPTRDDPHQAVNFVPNSTTGRWLQESQILFGNDPTAKTHLILNAVLALLAPPAIAEEKLRKKQEAEQAKIAAQQQAKKAETERLAKEKAELEEKLARETREREEAERAEAEAAASAARGPETTSENEDVIEEGAMEGVEPTLPEVVQSPAPESAEASTSAAPENRVFANFHGRQLDITSLAIDPEYLDALPEEMREEVLLSQIAEHRSQAATSGEQATELDREFLDALPDEIREELLEQEATERRRREQAQAQSQARLAQSNGDAPPRAEEMDPASFLASLDPGLRQSVLMEQDEDMLAQLPPAIAAEARLLGSSDRRLRQLMDNSSRLSRGRGVEHDQLQLPHIARRAQRRSAVQMLDKAGVATLLRLMFISQPGSGKTTLHSILRNVCQNRQNRAEVVSLLLSILQDGTADMNAVERSFNRLSVRARQTPAGKEKQPLDRAPAAHMSLADTDLSPLMVVTHCLQTLIFLTSQNLREFSLFFLTEHEAPSILKRNRKGKSKETKSSKYPLNSLLSLLDRKLILESSTAMEHLSSLLNSITQPLTMLLRPKEKAAEAESKKAEEKPADDHISLEPTGSNEPSPESNVAPEAASRTDASTLSDQALPDAPSVTDGQTSTSRKESSEEAKTDSKKERAFVPPIIPDENLRLVVNILAARECSSKTFQATLTTINSLSIIPDTKIVFGRELVRQAQALGKSILVDLDELVPQIQKAESSTDVQALARDRFSPASSDQAKLLRVLTALDYIFDTKRKDASKGPEGEDAPKQESLVNAVYETSTFGPLWTKLSDCLAAIRNRDGMLNIATILLPLIEALMVVCKNTTLKENSMAMSQRDFAVSSPPPEDRMENLFFKFTEEHRKILNDLVHNNPKLMSGTFSLLVKNPKVLEFDNKRSYFTRRLHSRGSEARHPHPPLQLSVRRDFVFLDSFKSLYFKSAKEMKYGKLSIRFHGEEGVDAGGVTREWFQVLSRQMFDPGYVLFTPVASDKTTFHPNRLSSVNDQHLMFFKFIGRVIGKALYEGRVLDCHFSRALYKRILGRVVSIKDMETLDLDYSKSLKWMLENDITDIITETFSVETDDFGEKNVIDLLPDGRNIPVIEENKAQYVQLVVEYRLTGSIQEQLEHFLTGFHDIVPAELISIFNEQELELLISGLPDIDVDDWKNNTEYHNYSASSAQIQWFWRAVRSFDKEERAKLLQFVTGTSKVPLNGFKELEGMNGVSRFNIHRDYGSKDRLPSSHTCFNQIDLPEYDTYESLRKHVYLAITAGSEYFGFA